MGLHPGLEARRRPDDRARAACTDTGSVNASLAIASVDIGNGLGHGVSGVDIRQPRGALADRRRIRPAARDPRGRRRARDRSEGRTLPRPESTPRSRTRHRSPWGSPARPLLSRDRRDERRGDPGRAPLAQLIATRQPCVALTGAGVSTESGIPDFRSPAGIWAEFDPLEYASLEAFRARSREASGGSTRRASRCSPTRSRTRRTWRSQSWSGAGCSPRS